MAGTEHFLKSELGMRKGERIVPDKDLKERTKKFALAADRKLNLEQK
jgi:hypothetical protein